MANAIAPDVELDALREEVRDLRRLVHEMDADMAELEWHAEFTKRTLSTHLFVIASVLRTLVGSPGEHPKYNYEWDCLYPMRPDGRHRQGRCSGWHIPERRWRQYGTKEELLALAAEHGVKVAPRTARWSIVTHLREAGVRLRVAGAGR